MHKTKLQNKSIQNQLSSSDFVNFTLKIEIGMVCCKGVESDTPRLIWFSTYKMRQQCKLSTSCENLKKMNLQYQD